MFLPFSVEQRGQRTVAGATCAAGFGAGAIGAPQAWQNAFCGGLSRWHCLHSMLREWTEEKGLRQDRALSRGRTSSCTRAQERAIAGAERGGPGRC
jgi:hypothetical protein